jgi:thymidylate synthase (FAD)
MKLIKPSFEIWEQPSGLEGVYKQIERAGRICYKSEDKITEDSAKSFVDRMIKSGHCYTGDTEVLTENGWVKFKDYSGEKVATINKDCSFKGFETPSRIVNYSYEGNFYYYPSLGIEVTDGHNMFGVFRENKNNFYKNNEYSLFKCNESYKDNNGREKTLGERMFKTPRHCLKNKSLNPYGELIGFWLGDGCYSPETKNKLVFHLKKQRKVEYLKQLCEELGYIFEERKANYYTVTNNNIGSSFNSLFYNNGKRISLKYFPSIDIAYSIINGLINSDGSLGINTKTVTFTNTSKSIIDWLLMYAPICGYSISYRGICHITAAHNPVYKILLLDTNYTLNNDSRNKDSKVIITNRVEEVYCVTVSTGLIMVRGTNGITTICGNCAMLEHGTVYLKVFNVIENSELIDKYKSNKYSVVKDGSCKCITTNYRVLAENGWLDDLKYICKPTEFHEKRITVHFVCDRGVSHEFVRHRVMSFAQESTRYCNYSKDKFGNELTFIQPCWLDDERLKLYGPYHTVIRDKSLESIFIASLNNAEKDYIDLIDLGWKPQEARAVLPNSLKTELVVTGFVSDWNHFFDLRARGTTGAPHPQAKELAEPLMKEFIARKYINN